MAKKSKHAAKKSAKSSAAAGKVRTKFMSAFIKQFVTSKANPWPAPGQTNASIIVDFETFMDVLISAAVTLNPPTSGGGASLADRIASFLIANQWPVSTPIPKQWQSIQPTVRLIEVSVIADGLLKAINKGSGAGGGGSGWPPH
jgi:hypothetical protein